MHEFSESIFDIELEPATEETDAVVRSFFSFDEIEEWATYEYQFWSDLLGVQGNTRTQPEQAIWNQFLAHLKSITSNAVAGKKAIEKADDVKEPSDPRAKGHIDNLATVPILYSSGPCLLSSSDKAKYLEQFDDVNIRKHTFAAFAGFTSQDPQFLIQGQLEAYRFRHGPEDTVEATREALENLQTEFTEQITELRKKFNAAVGNANTKTSEFETAHTDALSQAKEILAKLDKKYRDEIGTREAVAYFKNKKWWHNVKTIIFTLFAGGWFTLGGVGLYALVMNFGQHGAESFLGEVAARMEDGTGLTTMFFAIGGLAIFIYVWIARLFVRFLLSNAHLASDAAEREMATQVFLALMEEEKAVVSDADRGYVLENIFRPTALGMIKDDSAPPTPFNEAVRRIEGK